MDKTKLYIGIGLASVVLLGGYFYFKSTPEKRKKQNLKTFKALKESYGSRATLYANAIKIPFPGNKPYHITLYTNNRFAILKDGDESGLLYKGYWDQAGGRLRFDEGRVYTYSNIADVLNVLKDNLFDE